MTAVRVREAQGQDFI